MTHRVHQLVQTAAQLLDAFGDFVEMDLFLGPVTFDDIPGEEGRRGGGEEERRASGGAAAPHTRTAACSKERAQRRRSTFEVLARTAQAAVRGDAEVHRVKK